MWCNNELTLAVATETVWLPRVVGGFNGTSAFDELAVDVFGAFCDDEAFVFADGFDGTVVCATAIDWNGIITICEQWNSFISIFSMWCNGNLRDVLWHVRNTILHPPKLICSLLFVSIVRAMKCLLLLAQWFLHSPGKKYGMKMLLKMELNEKWIN